MAFPIPQVLTYTYHAEGILNGGEGRTKGESSGAFARPLSFLLIFPCFYLLFSLPFLSER